MLIIGVEQTIISIINLSAMKQEKQQAIFEDILSQLKPKSRYTAQIFSQELTDSLFNELMNGQNSISKEQLNIDNIVANHEKIERWRNRYLSQAQKQKQQLQHKLQSLEHHMKALERSSPSKSSKNIKGQFELSKSIEREKEVKKKKQQRTQKINQKKKYAEEIILKKKKQLQETEEQMEREEKEKKKKLILEKMKKLQERIKERQKFIEEGKKRYEEKKRQKSLFEKMLKKFQEKEAVQLQDRKRKLAQIRSFHKSIDLGDLQVHDRKFLELKRQKQQIRERQLRMNQSNSYQPYFYKSAFYRKAQQDERYQPQNDSEIRAQKMKRFSEHVKEHFIPQIDEKKKSKIQKIINDQKEREDQRKQKEELLNGKSRVLGQKYLENLKSLQRPKKKLKPQQSGSNTARIHYKNYLTHDYKKDQAPWKKILDRDANKKDKALVLHFESERVEQELKRKEQQIKLNKKDLQDEVDEQYYDMIRAKLDLLQLD